jgi:hypothetical protein
MSDFNVIHNVSLELRSQIFAALDTTPMADFGLTGGIESITLQAPLESLADSIRASLFLYHVDIDKHLRNQRPLPDRARDDQSFKPPLPLQLRYLFTPLATAEEDGHALLGRVMQHFHDAPVMTTLGGTALDDSRGGATAALRIKPDMLSLEQLAQLWNALSSPFRLSVAFMVETIAVDSGLPARSAPRVDEFVRATGLMKREEAGA